jgi:hypothetical protein
MTEQLKMAFAFDALGYAKRLRDAGIPQPQAEATQKQHEISLWPSW